MHALIDTDLVDEIGSYWVGKNGYAIHGCDKLVHRTIMEKIIGRKLETKEQVHHKDYNKLNNLRENLVFCPDAKFHKMIHARQDVINDGYNPDTHHYCTHHKRYELHSCFSNSRHSWNGLHNMCREGTIENRKLNGNYTSIWNVRGVMNQQYRRAKAKNLCSDIPSTH